MPDRSASRCFAVPPAKVPQGWGDEERPLPPLTPLVPQGSLAPSQPPRVVYDQGGQPITSFPGDFSRNLGGLSAALVHGEPQTEPSSPPPVKGAEAPPLRDDDVHTRKTVPPREPAPPPAQL